MSNAGGKNENKQSPAVQPQGGEDAALEWRCPKEPPFRLAGFAWFAQDGVYRRLPVKPIPVVPPNVDYLANHTAGGQIHFRTDATRLCVRVRLKNPPDMDHMPATGQCGFDCYIGPTKKKLYCSTARVPLREVSYEQQMFAFPARTVRDVTLNFPLYQGVEEVQVGVPKGATVRPPRPYGSKLQAIFYGTSITQGGCANRPGMAYTNILSRRFNIEFINLGFSGNGRGEPEVAQVIAQIPNPGCFVLDYEANCREGIGETLPGFIRILRQAHPRTPILVLSAIPGSAETHFAGSRRARKENLRMQQRLVERLRRQGDKRVFFHEGTNLLGRDYHECSVDGCHPTDLGFWRMAEALTPVLRRILGGVLRT